MTDKKIIEILKSGDFTLAYHDHEYCNLYRGKFDDYSDLKGKSIELNDPLCGYMTPEAVVLVAALGGKIVTI